MSVVDARSTMRAFQSCVTNAGAGGHALCETERVTAVKSIANSTSGQCAPYAEDFFQCFNHRYRLSTCNDGTVSKLLRCQEQFSGTITGQVIKLGRFPITAV